MGEDDDEEKFGITKNGKGQKPWTIASRDGFNLLNARQRFFIFIFFFFLLYCTSNNINTSSSSILQLCHSRIK